MWTEQTRSRRVAIGRVAHDVVRGHEAATIEEVERAVRNAVELAGGFDRVVRPGSKVMVKPNLCMPEVSGSGVVTDARVVEAVTRVVLDQNPSSVVIADGAIAGFDDGSVSTEEAFDVSGVANVARKLGVEYRNLNADEVVDLAVPHPSVLDTIRVARTAVESDALISVPVLKSHLRTMATVSLKNMWGVLPGAEKRVGHMQGLDGAIVDLLSVAAPTYAVVDATTGSEGLWRSPNDCQPLGLIVAGNDPFLVDVASVRLMGMDPLAMGYLRRMVNLGWVSGLDDMDVTGEHVEDHTRIFRKAFDAFMDAYPGVRVVQGRWACSGCTNDLVGALRYTAAAGCRGEMEGLTVVIGEHEEPFASERVAAIGKCAERHQSHGCYAPGCPPREEDIIEAVCCACGVDTGPVVALRDKTRAHLWESTRHLLLR